MVSPCLLSISQHPTIMDTSIKNPRMINPGTEQIFIRQNTDLGGLEVHTTDAVIETDTTAARESMGVGQLSNAHLIDHYVQKAKEHCAQYTREIVQDGKAVEKNRTTQAELARIHHQEDMKPDEVVTAFYPSAPAEVHVNPGTTSIDHHPTEVNIDWENTQIVPYYLDRGTVDFTIVQKAYVDITYLGDPIYFPASAEPAFSARA